jgi:hypothetical protein
LYETARVGTFESSDPFALAVRFAAAGNTLDAMVDVIEAADAVHVTCVPLLDEEPALGTVNLLVLRYA